MYVCNYVMLCYVMLCYVMLCYVMYVCMYVMYVCMYVCIDMYILHVYFLEGLPNRTIYSAKPGYFRPRTWSNSSQLVAGAGSCGSGKVWKFQVVQC